MRKQIILLVLAVVAYALPAGAAKLTVADGSGSSSSFGPFNSDNYPSVRQHNQIIYPAEKLTAMTGTRIKSMTFYLMEVMVPNPGGRITFSLANIEAGSSFDSDKALVTADLTQVYSSEPTFATEWTITFDENSNFIYSGGDLLIDVTVEPGREKLPLTFYGESQDKSSIVYYFEDDEYYESSSSLPKVKYSYGAPSMELTSSKKIDCSSAVGTGEAIVPGKLVVKNTGDVPLKPVVNFSGANAGMFSVSPAEPVEIAAGDSAEYSIIFNAASCTETGVFTAGISITDPDDEATPIEGITVRGAALTSARDTVFATRNDRNWNVPICTLESEDFYPESQFIYPAEKVAVLKGRRITGIKFFAEKNFLVNGGKFQLSIKETEQTVFTAAGVDKVTDMTAIATASISKTTNVVEFVFTEPIAYHGGNLAIEVSTLERTPLNVYTHWLGGYQDNTPAYFKYGEASDEKSLENFLPRAEFTTTDCEPTYSMEVTSGRTIIGSTSMSGSGKALDTAKLTVTNTGNQTLKPVVTFSGENASMFSAYPSGPVELAAGGSAEFVITFVAPEGLEPGDYTAGVIVTDALGCADPINDVTVRGVAITSAQNTVCITQHDKNWKVPIKTNSSSFNNPESQFIYPAEKVAALQGRRIIGIKFIAEENIQVHGGKFQLSVKETDQDVFTAAGVDKVTDMTIAATASIGDNTSELYRQEPCHRSPHSGAYLES